MYFPLVSILITSYNRVNYLRDAIESALNQTYPNIEIIITDNCSDDGTIDLLDQYRHHSSVLVVINDENIGQFPNRNKAAYFAKGKYIKFLDSDDILLPHCVEVMVKGMEEYKGSAIGTAYDIRTFDPRPFPFLINPVDAIHLHYTEGLLFQGPGAIIYRKDFFDEFGGFEDVGLSSDNLLTLRIASKYDIVALPRDLYWWRRHENQAFNNMVNNVAVHIESYKLNMVILQSKSCPISAQWASFYLRCNKTRLCRYCCINLIKGRFFVVYRLITETDLTIIDFFLSCLPVKILKPNC